MAHSISGIGSASSGTGEAMKLPSSAYDMTFPPAYDMASEESEPEPELTSLSEIGLIF